MKGRICWAAVLAGGICAVWLLESRGKNTAAEPVLSTLTVATSGGLIQDAGRQVLWDPAAKALGVEVREESFEDGYQLLRLQSASGRVSIDVIELPGFLAARGYREGIIGPLDYRVIDATAFSERFRQPYCIGMLSASWVLGWNAQRYPGPEPATWADFWDVKKFPGRRGAKAGAEAQLEIALMADGVAPQDVYAALSQPGGMRRAIDKWAALKPYLSVWWTSGSQLAQLMKDGELDLAIGWNGRFEPVLAAGAPVKYTYADGVLASDCWAVPAQAPRRALAMQLINEMVKPSPQARFSAMVKYGPLNPQAFATGQIPPDIAIKLPTHPANLPAQLAESDRWWAENSASAERAFDDMRSR